MYVTYYCETCDFACDDEYEMEVHEQTHHIEGNITNAKFYDCDGKEMALKSVACCSDEVFFIVNATQEELNYLFSYFDFSSDICKCYTDPEDVIYYDDKDRNWKSAKKELEKIQRFVNKVQGASK